jgi:hypothetical protein
MKLFVVYDEKSESYGPPMAFGSLGLAQRWFRQALSGVKSDSHLSQYPSDMRMYCVGTYDQSNGSFSIFPKMSDCMHGFDELVAAQKERNDLDVQLKHWIQNEDKAA